MPGPTSFWGVHETCFTHSQTKRHAPMPLELGAQQAGLSVFINIVLCFQTTAELHETLKAYPFLGAKRGLDELPHYVSA